MTEFSDRTFVFVSSHPGPSVGRIEQRLVRVIAALRGLGANVTFICPPESPAVGIARTAGANVLVYPLSRANYMRTRSRLKKYLKRYRPVVAHSTGFEADVLLRMAAEDLDTPIVNSVTCAAWPVRRGPGTPRTLRRRLDAKTVGRVDVLAIDCAELEGKIAEAGMAVKRILLDPPSIDLGSVRSRAEQPSGIAFEDGLAYIGYAGRLESSRGLETLIAAERSITRGHSKARVMVVGAGPARARLVGASAGRATVSLPGKAASVPAVLARLEVCCFPSNVPGTPTSLLEAAALGRPIVGSDISGISELFKDAEEILLVAPGDAKALASAVTRLLDDASLAARLGAAARLRTTDSYSSAVAVDRFLALYRELAAL